MEFTLETVQGKTRLRLVHSGFGHGAAWDAEVDGISEGWQAELRSLRHYLRRHRGRDRRPRAGWSTLPCRARLRGIDSYRPGGYRLTPPLPKEGEPFEVVTPSGKRYTGTVELNLPGQTLAGTVRELDDGWFRLLTWRDARGHTGVWLARRLRRPRPGSPGVRRRGSGDPGSAVSNLGGHRSGLRHFASISASNPCRATSAASSFGWSEVTVTPVSLSS